MAKVICLTGGLASGKSTAARFLKEQGAHVIDADLLGHRAYDPGTVSHGLVVKTFGDDVLAADGKIDRKVLGGKVFGKPDQLKRLTDIVWPEIRRLAENEIASVQQAEPNRIIVLEAAVLFEAGWDDVGDEVWVNSVDRAVAIARAMARDNIPQAAIESRLDAQWSNEQRKARANAVIDNNGTTAEMLAQLRVQWQRLQRE